MRKRQDVINTARLYIGAVQGDGNHLAIVNTYNSFKPLPRGYKLGVNDPWCAAFVSAVSIKLGYTDIMPVECSCNRLIDTYKVMGCWQESDSYCASEGDLIFYDWDDNGNGDNIGVSDHVGIIERCDGKNFVVIEGNKGSKHECARRTISVNGRYIRGFACPRYDAEPIKTKLYVGDEISLKPEATYYNGKSIPKWVQNSKLYYRGENPNGAIISILKSGPITGVVPMGMVCKK